MRVIIYLFFAIIACSFNAFGKEIKVSPEDGKINFGNYPANLTKKQVFVLQNNSESTVNIGKVYSSCECSVAEVQQKVLKPGERTEVIATIPAQTIEGYFSKTIRIETDLPSQKFINITLQGNSIPLIKVEPSPYLYLGTLRRGAVAKYSFFLRCNPAQVVFELPKGVFNNYITLEVEKKADGVKIQISINTKLAPTDFYIEIPIKITSPENWKPVMIKLKGTVKDITEKNAGGVVK